MRVPQRLVEVWAADADGRGRCGSGWVVGQSGVLCCRHVLDRYLAGVEKNRDRPAGRAKQPVLQIRRATASSATDWIDCILAWQHPARDLVLLQITPGAEQSWDPPTEQPTRLAATGQRPSACAAIGFPEAAVKPTRLRGSDQAAGQLLPAGGARDPQGLVPFDVDTSVPEDAALWAGFSGSAVHDEHDRLVALVAKVHPDRRQRRLLIVPVEDAASDPAFASEAAAVGLDPTVEDHQTPLWRRSVDPRALAASGVPARVADVGDLRAFGVHSSPVDGQSRYPGYVARDRDSDLDTALADARAGGCRIVLVVGDSAAGKTRSACEALGRDQVLRGWRMVVPLADGGLSRLVDADLGWRDTVLWLDDLDKYLGRGLDLGTLRRVLGAAANVVVVATMRRSQLLARQNELADPAWAFLTDDAQVTRVDLNAALSDRELEAAHAEFSDPALLSALEEGVGLGEWLVAGPELMKKLSSAAGFSRAFADTVIAWYRTGLQQPLTEEDTQRLWTSTLPPSQRQRLLAHTLDDRDALFQKSSAWACEPVISRDLYEQALVTRSAEGYIAHDFVVDRVVRDPQRPAIPDPIWHHALQVAISDLQSGNRPKRAWSVGIAAFDERAFAHAMTAMQSIAETGNAGALVDVGRLLGDLGRFKDAIGVYDQVVDRFGDAIELALREQVAKALVGKGIMFGQLDRFEDEIGVYDQVVDCFGDAIEPVLREQVARALVNKGYRLGDLDRLEDAIGVYDQTVKRFGDAIELALREQVANALVNKVVTFGQLGCFEDVIGVCDHMVKLFGNATESVLLERVASALINKGVAFVELGRFEDAIVACDQVVDRFGGATEPALRELAARAQRMKAEMESGGELT